MQDNLQMPRRMTAQIQNSSKLAVCAKTKPFFIKFQKHPRPVCLVLLRVKKQQQRHKHKGTRRATKYVRVIVSRQLEFSRTGQACPVLSRTGQGSQGQACPGVRTARVHDVAHISIKKRVAENQ